MTEKIETYKPVVVTWLDATHQAGWHDGHEIEEFVSTEPLRIESLGWLVGETDSWIVLAQSASEKKAGELLKIPRSIIESTDYL